MAKPKETKEKERKGPSALEWASAAVGALLVIAILAFIVMKMVATDSGKPPLLHVRPTAIFAEDGLYVVEVKVANRSAQTGAAVKVEGRLMRGGSAVETATATVSYVPGHSERDAGLIFSRDPRRYTLEVGAKGYELP